MLTVDDIRRELEKTKVLVKKISPEQEDLAMGEIKSCKHHPDRPARIAATGRSLGLCQECFAASKIKMAATKLGRPYKAPPVGPKPTNPGAMRLKSAKVDPKPAKAPTGPRLVLAETLTCPKCGAQLMFKESDR